MDNTRECSFYELISMNDIIIKIPKVQRDYVQGRDNEHAKMVLEQLLEDIKKALDQNHIPLQLQFVYGKKNDGFFIPIDGQQRLTTLFLLHVYAFRNDASMDDILKRFTYETRATSRDFIEKLVKNRKELFAEKENAEKASLKEVIIDAAWFNPLAIYDPTVSSMMNALEMIYEKFRDYEKLDEKLKDSENKMVVFRFLDMDNLGREDSLYIKLNARGKQLTKFENFKATLFGKLEKIEEYSLDEKNEFVSSFDNKWTDIFWHCAMSTNEKEFFDTVFERFFKILLANLEILVKKDKEDKTDTNILEIDSPEVEGKINKTFFDTIKYLLNYLANKDNEGTLEYKEIKSGTIDILTKEYTYEDRVLSHMLICFIREVKGDVSRYSKEYKCWTRVLRNLIYNTTIDTEEKRKNAVASVNKLVEHWQELYKYIQCGEQIRFFETHQVAEEREKIKILLAEEGAKTNTFTTEIHRAEQHPYFKGKISGALYRAYDERNKTYDVDKFIEYWEKIECLFDNTKPKDGVKLCRALLSYGDYRKSVSAYKTLCVDAVNDSAGTPSMKSLFSLPNSMYLTDSDNIVTRMLDDLCLRNGYDNGLDRIIDTNKSSISQDDWRWCLVNYDNYNRLFNFMGKRRMRNDYGEELLIRNTSASGLNPNIFLAVVGLEIDCEITNPDNYPERGAAVEHRLYFHYIEGKGKWLYLVQKDKKIQIKSCDGNNLQKYWDVKEFSGANMIKEAINYCKACKKGEWLYE